MTRGESGGRGLTDDLGTFVAEHGFDDEQVREKARILLVDALALASAARSAPGLEAVTGLAPGRGEYLVWMTGERLGASDAVLVNGTCVHARFQDDVEMSSWTHPASFVIPAVAAAAEHAQASFGQLLDGIIAGYATAAWMGAHGEVASKIIRNGFRPSPLFAPISSAAGAARALGLPAPETAHALSAAALVARGTLQSVGTGGDDWRLHNSCAARDGFTLALAAGAGMVSGRFALEGSSGFLNCYARTDEIPEAWQAPPDARSVLGVWHKAVPTLGDNMAVCLAAMELHRKLGDAKVLAIRIRMNKEFYNYPGTQAEAPFDTFTQALAAVRFVAARCLLRGTIDLQDYQDRTDEGTVELSRRIEVEGADLDFIDAEISAETDQGTLSVNARDLPREVFFRDPEMARRAASRLLGDGGTELANTVLDADEAVPAKDVLEQAISFTLIGRHESA